MFGDGILRIVVLRVFSLLPNKVEFDKSWDLKDLLFKLLTEPKRTDHLFFGKVLDLLNLTLFGATLASLQDTDYYRDDSFGYNVGQIGHK